jgi:hypothetical protein
MKIEFDIYNCDECPRAVISKVYTPDPFDDTRKIVCSETGETIYPYLDWYEKSPIPFKCPLRSVK